MCTETARSFRLSVLQGVCYKRTRSVYGPNKEKFVFAQSLSLFSCILNVIFAKMLLVTFLKEGVDTTRKAYYAISAFTYLGAMIASTIALEYLNYATQVVGKSCKPIPVMILGVLIGRKHYGPAKYLTIFVIVVGVCLFMYKDHKATKASQSMFGTGELLLLVSLTLDGVTGAIQNRMKTEHKTKSGTMMLMTNLWSVLYLIAAQIFTQEVWAFLAFVQRFPHMLYNVLLFALAGALGQTMIFRIVSEYGPLSCSVVTTTRKFFTVLGSVIIFNNPLGNRQWVGVVLVFSGLLLDSYLSGKKKSVD
ncbi:solute carrier family 35 member B1-like isoform X2 [Ornithodoros turicata]|uniref:solute carrier family 35 member B1-like isoform X2 n=1 Tax=Ornithodoros turicata TaxID=34597 RepID=UPI0031388769